MKTRVIKLKNGMYGVEYCHNHLYNGMSTSECWTLYFGKTSLVEAENHAKNLSKKSEKDKLVISEFEDGKTDCIAHCHMIWKKGENPEYTKLKVI